MDQKDSSVLIAPLGGAADSREVGDAYTEPFGDAGSVAVMVVAPPPQNPGIVCVTSVLSVAQMIAQFWNAGWFTAGKAVCAVSNLRLSCNDRTTFVLAEIDGRERVVFQVDKNWKGHQDANPIKMLKGGIKIGGKASRNDTVPHPDEIRHSEGAEALMSAFEEGLSEKAHDLHSAGKLDIQAVYTLIKEALDCGADAVEIDRREAATTAEAVHLFKDGNAWCAVRPWFINLQESIAGFGDTADAAIQDLIANEEKARGN